MGSETLRSDYETLRGMPHAASAQEERRAAWDRQTRENSKGRSREAGRETEKVLCNDEQNIKQVMQQ